MTSFFDLNLSSTPISAFFSHACYYEAVSCWKHSTLVVNSSFSEVSFLFACFKSCSSSSICVIILFWLSTLCSFSLTTLLYVSAYLRIAWEDSTSLSCISLAIALIYEVVVSYRETSMALSDKASHSFSSWELLNFSLSSSASSFCIVVWATPRAFSISKIIVLCSKSPYSGCYPILSI